MRHVTAPRRLFERMATRLGGPRLLVLPLLRALAVVAGVLWVAIAPRTFPAWSSAALTVLAFALYSTALTAAVVLWPGRVLRWNVAVLALDLGFALALVWLTGPDSTLFLALLLIGGVQSYYYGTRRGVLVALISGAAYLALVWPIAAEFGWANVAIRLAVLVGTAFAIGVLADVEEAERTKVAALTAVAQDHERFIRNVLESLEDGVVVVDRDGRAVTWNGALAERFGAPVPTGGGRALGEVLPLAGAEPLARPLGEVLAGTREAFRLEGLEHVAPGGRRIILTVTGSRLRQAAGIAGAVLLVEDITRRVALERSARQTEKLAALGTLAAGLAHELNNPIGIICSRIELALIEHEGADVPEGLREDLHVLHRNAQRVASIAQRLLSFARSAPGEPGPVDVNEVVEETLLLVERDLAKRGIAVRRVLAPGLPPVRGDANALQQVVLNLLTNARDAMAGGGEVTVETAAVADPPGAVRLAVRDSGPGMPPDVAARVFDPFFTTKPHGTGLGLSISHSIVRDHRGTIDVESQPGRGTTFVLTFPGATEGDVSRPPTW